MQNKRIFINEAIRAKEVRVIGADGSQIGVLPLAEAVSSAKQQGLDLIQITEKVDPPVCKIMDYGKYAYQQKKKERKTKPHAGEIKGIRLTFGISQHDLQVRAAAVRRFLTKGHKARIEMRLKGRQKALGKVAQEKMLNFVTMIQAEMPVKVERELKREPRGLTMIIAKDNYENTQSSHKTV